MKTTLAACAIALFLASTALAGWIEVTVATVWPDGLNCSVGEVERLVSETEQTWVIEAPGGNRTLPKAHAKPITDEQAAVALFIQRQALYAALEEAAADKQAAGTMLDRRPETPKVGADGLTSSERYRRKRMENEERARRDAAVAAANAQARQDEATRRSLERTTRELEKVNRELRQR